MCTVLCPWCSSSVAKMNWASEPHEDQPLVDGAASAILYKNIGKGAVDYRIQTLEGNCRMSFSNPFAIWGQFMSHSATKQTLNSSDHSFHSQVLEKESCTFLLSSWATKRIHHQSWRFQKTFSPCKPARHLCHLTRLNLFPPKLSKCSLQNRVIIDYPTLT